MISSGVGQTSRVDALKHAIEKAKTFGFDIKGSVMASDAFFPFPDCVEIAAGSGICSIVQPGGSIKDDLSKLYVNRGPGSFAGIRNSLALVKGIHMAKKIDYYCFSFDDFDNFQINKYENVPILCDKFKIKKNLINPIYIS